MTTPEDTSVEAVLLWAAYHGYTAIYNETFKVIEDKENNDAQNSLLEIYEEIELLKSFNSQDQLNILFVKFCQIEKHFTSFNSTLINSDQWFEIKRDFLRQECLIHLIELVQENSELETLTDAAELPDPSNEAISVYHNNIVQVFKKFEAIYHLPIVTKGKGKKASKPELSPEYESDLASFTSELINKKGKKNILVKAKVFKHLRGSELSIFVQYVTNFLESLRTLICSKEPLLQLVSEEKAIKPTQTSSDEQEEAWTASQKKGRKSFIPPTSSQLEEKSFLSPTPTQQPVSIKDVEKIRQKNKLKDPLNQIIGAPRAEEDTIKSIQRVISPIQPVSKKRIVESSNGVKLGMTELTYDSSDSEEELARKRLRSASKKTNSDSEPSEQKSSVVQQLVTTSKTTKTQKEKFPDKLTTVEPPATKKTKKSGDHDPTDREGGTVRYKWTNEEELALIRGVEIYGVGNWSFILKDNELGPILFRRNNVHLKDKYRNLLKTGVIEGGEQEEEEQE